MRDLAAMFLVILSGPAVLCAYIGWWWPVGAWLAATALTIAPPLRWRRRHG